MQDVISKHLQTLGHERPMSVRPTAAAANGICPRPRKKDQTAKLKHGHIDRTPGLQVQPKNGNTDVSLSTNIARILNVECRISKIPMWEQSERWAIHCEYIEVGTVPQTPGSFLVQASLSPDPQKSRIN